MAYLALYRLYRPKTFANVVGQEHITTTLKNQVVMNRIGHAYLFSGARGTGKTSTAKVFAKALNCLDPHEGEPCGVCSVCQMSDEDLSVDILEIDAASNNGVDEIRDLRDKIRFAPTFCKYKVYIIDEVHMLSTGAFNALLKTLEEPPAHAVFILATTEMQKLPATILSRCQRFDFKRIPESVIIEQLQHVAEQQGAQCEEQALQEIAHAAGGGMRDALSLLDQCLGFAGQALTYQNVVEILGAAGMDAARKLGRAILEADIASCMDIIESVYDGGSDMAVFAREMVEYFRQEMIDNAKQGTQGLALRAVEEFSRAESMMRFSSRPRVELEIAAVRLCVSSQGQDVSALLERIERLEATVTELRERPAASAQPVAATAAVQQETPPAQEPVLERPAVETRAVQPDGQPEEKRPEPPKPEAKAPEPTGMDADGLLQAVKAAMKKEAKAAVGPMAFIQNVKVEEDTFIIEYNEKDFVFAEIFKNDKIMDIARKAASEAAGREMDVQCYCGAGGEAPTAPKKEHKTDNLEQAKNAFNMEIEITD